MSAPPPAEPFQKHIRESVQAALREDIGSGDLTAGLVPDNQQARACVISRAALVICGRPWFDEVFRQLDPAVHVHWAVSDGDAVDADAMLCELRGPARAILTGERTALNFLQTLSATATVARRYAEAVAGTAAKVLDTRKTIPGLRLAQKYAVRVGGAGNHRIGLFDAILIKENHIIAAGSITAAVRAARVQAAAVLLEVEVETLAQVAEAFKAGADRLLLDNFSIEGLREAVALRNRDAPDITLEASGGVTLQNIHAIAATGVDFISVGALTKSIQAADLSMRFFPV